ncbi:MAG TPA: M28 family peptidase [Jatrophihabitantaceae bacterium]|nr:M28 family peptidase [Jatrophihabitantaceae bacterium]
MTPPGDDLVSCVSALPVDSEQLLHVIDTLTSIGSSELGYRNTGTPEDAATAAFVAEEMRAMGLCDVGLEDVPVDAWRFLSASLSIAGEAQPLHASSFGGVPGTPDDGITARLVDVGDAKRARLDRVELDGCIALLDWRTKRVHPSVVVLELARRGVVGVIVNCPARGAWFQGEGALGAFDAQWPTGAPPMIMVSRNDAAHLRERLRREPCEVTLALHVESTRNALGHNVVGFLPGTKPGPIVVGAHHDAWFRGAFDNASGVAAMLAVANALVTTGYRPQHTICFTSRTGEEYGRLDEQYDWCIGAWEQIATTHPTWADDAPIHLCLEASGHPSLRTIIEAPVEYRAWARTVCTAAEAVGWTPTGWRVAAPVAGTEQWPYLLRGVPGVAAYAWETSFADSDYHTQLDTSANVDGNILAAHTRLYALLLLDADRRPDAIVDHRARARALARIARQTRHEPLAAAAETHREAEGRAAFTAVGRHLHALDAETVASYPHQQALRDAAALAAALAALDEGNRREALRQLSKVGSNRLHPYLSKPALQAHLDQFRPDAVASSWGSASHLTETVNLWDEMTALSGGDVDDDWLHSSLELAHASAQREVSGRLDAMALAITTR